MSGHLQGVATRIKSEEPAALFVHCLAHRLNLCLQDSARICVLVRDTLVLVMEVVKLIQYSPNRSNLFDSLKLQTSPHTSGLRPLCPSMWTVRSSATAAILDNYGPLSATPEEVSESGYDKYAVKASGFNRQRQLFSTLL